MADLRMVNARLGWFFKVMQRKMATTRKVAKGDWRDMDVEDIFKHLTDEMKELKAELKRPGGDADAVMLKCAEVASFAFMIADHARRMGGRFPAAAPEPVVAVEDDGEMEDPE